MEEVQAEWGRHWSAIAPLMKDHRPPPHRSVLRAVAYLAGYTSRPAELGILLRLLEEFVWRRGGLLIVDPGMIAEVMWTSADQAGLLSPSGAGDLFGAVHDADPRVAAAEVLEMLRADGNRSLEMPPTGEFVGDEHGRTWAVPRAARWALRAALAEVPGAPSFASQEWVPVRAVSHTKLRAAQQDRYDVVAAKPDIHRRHRPLAGALQIIAELLAPHIEYVSIHRNVPGETEIPASTDEDGPRRHPDT